MFTLWDRLKNKKFKISTLLDILLMALVVLAVVFVQEVRGAEKKWHLSTVQYQISPDCSHDVALYSRRAAAEISKHSVTFTEGVDAVYVSCEYSNPFANAMSYLAPGTSSEDHLLQIEHEDENLILGVTRTTWYTESLQIFKAQIWIDPIIAQIFGNLEGVVKHEFAHAVGEPHVFGGLMQSNAQGDYFDAATIVRIRSRYDKTQASVMDSEGDFYLPCLFVPSELASLVGADGGFYWVQTKAGQITDFGASECE